MKTEGGGRRSEGGLSRAKCCSDLSAGDGARWETDRLTKIVWFEMKVNGKDRELRV